MAILKLTDVKKTMCSSKISRKDKIGEYYLLFMLSIVKKFLSLSLKGVPALA